MGQQLFDIAAEINARRWRALRTSRPQLEIMGDRYRQSRWWWRLLQDHRRLDGSGGQEDDIVVVVVFVAVADVIVHVDWESTAGRAPVTFLIVRGA